MMDKIKEVLKQSKEYEIPEGVKALPVMPVDGREEWAKSLAEEFVRKDKILDLAKEKEQTLRPGGCSYCNQFEPKDERSAMARVVQYNGDKVSYWEEYDEDGMLVLREETSLKHC